MSNQNPLSSKLPHWVFQIAGALSGWLIFLFNLFLILIGISAILSRWEVKVELGSGLFFMELAFAVTVAFVCGIYIGRKTTRWISKKNTTFAYLCLTLLVLVTLLSFPAPFGFVKHGN